MQHKIAAALLIAVLATGAIMDTSHAGPVNERQKNQHARIKQGVQSGTLTKKEAHHMRAEQKAFKAKEQAYKADGNLSRMEKRDLKTDQNKMNKQIYHQKHDNQTR